MGWGPDAPDMSGANAAAESGAKLSKEQWDDYVQNVRPKADAQADRMIKISEDQYNLNRDGQVFQQGLMKKQDDRYQNIIAPMEDAMFADAASFDTEARREELAGAAGGDVRQGMKQAGGALQRGLAIQGVNLSSGKALALGNQNSQSEALALTNAMNKARTAARMEGYGRKVDATAMGKGLSGFNSGTMQGFASGALSSAGMGMNGLTALQGMTNSTASGASNGLQSASQNLRANAIESAKNPGFDAMMGLAAGGMQLAGSTMKAGTGWSFSDRRLKTDIRLVGTLPNDLGVYTFRYKSGGPVVMGVMADEVEHILPHAVDKNYQGTGYSAVDYSQLGAAA